MSGSRFILPRLSGTAHDYLYVGLKKGIAPGIVRKLDVERAHDADLKKPGGKDGMTPTTNGEHPVEVTIVLELWDDPEDPAGSEVLTQYLTYFLDHLFPEGKAPKPMDVAHPKLALHRLKSLFFLKFTGPTEIGYSHWQVTLKAVNFKPPTKKKATSTPKLSDAGYSGSTAFKPSIDGGFNAVTGTGTWTPPKSPTASKPRP